MPVGYNRIGRNRVCVFDRDECRGPRGLRRIGKDRTDVKSQDVDSGFHGNECSIKNYKFFRYNYLRNKYNFYLRYPVTCRNVCRQENNQSNLDEKAVGVANKLYPGPVRIVLHPRLVSEVIGDHTVPVDNNPGNTHDKTLETDVPENKSKYLHATIPYFFFFFGAPRPSMGSPKSEKCSSDLKNDHRTNLWTYTNSKQFFYNLFREN